jgi:hypothetical protein
MKVQPMKELFADMRSATRDSATREETPPPADAAALRVESAEVLLRLPPAPSR